MSFTAQEKPLVSIIMPAYNCEKYIWEAVNSVIDQTYQEWELIIIDDGSNDNTIKIVEKLTDKNKRIRFFKNEKNQGVSATRNRGISLANGEWIAFLDSDDIWEKNKLDKQISYAKKVNADFVFTGSSFINGKGQKFKGIFEVPLKVDFKKLRTHNVISCSSVLIKKEYFRSIRMERDDMHEDYAVWLRILKTGIYAFGINEPLLIYRITHSSKSGNKMNTIKMTYKVFRFININPIGSAYFVSRHIMGSIKKYRIIKKVY